MKACKLRHQITFEQKSETQDSFGQPVEVWVPFVTARADIEPLRGKELFTAQQVNGELTTKITIRYLAGINEKMRAVHGSVVYNLTPPVDIGMRHAWLEIMASSGLNNG